MVKLPWRALAGRLLLVGFSVVLCCGVLEVMLRTVPALVPHGVYYGSGVYDPDLGFQLPVSKVVYNKVRYVERWPNGEGFMDLDHDVAKPAGVVRVGFFGDSYVESVQVPLEDVFFRRLPATIGNRAIEPFGFGMSGLGTLHAFELYRKFGRRYNLDLVVYLFVDNDPGNQLDAVQRARPGLYAARPTAAPAADGQDYRVFPARPPVGSSAVRRLATLIKDRSLLSRVVYARLQLLSRRVQAEGNGLSEDAPPSEWPAEARAEAGLLARLLISRWRDEVQFDGRQFLVFYVPRPAELDGDLGNGSWRAWLLRTCNELGIETIDPTAAMAARQRLGDEVYGDHWTPAGHDVVASELATFFSSRVPSGEP